MIWFIYIQLVQCRIDSTKGGTCRLLFITSNNALRNLNARNTGRTEAGTIFISIVILADPTDILRPTCMFVVQL